ncbi:hypothetical protein L596_028495 [Steinernema carpocapsae]|uniref:CCD97-like C-terminal domain-containing protein n=1 Tax=Steinernema carpocapsae TaxID=34508 RepID=A0A4U5LYN7_STECR|nr:hypothetical protein L596_028495 [Steinernema carpocapsae]
MREREPFLFDKMVGRFLTDEEKVHLRPTVENTGTLSGLLEEFDQAQRVSDRRQDELSDGAVGKGPHFQRQPMPHLLAQASTSRSVADSILRHADQRMGVDNDFEPEFESDDESEEALKSVARKMQKVAVKHEDEEYKPMEEEESASGSSMDEGDDTLGQDMLREEFISTWNSGS